MSVINQMLKDLATRTKKTNMDEKGLMSLYTFSESNRKIYLKQKIVMSVVILIIALISTIIFGYFYLHTQSKAHAAKYSVQIDKSSIPPSAFLSAITLQVEKTKTSLHFLLNKKPLYHLSKLDNNQLMLVLEHTHGIIAQPQFNKLNSAIQSMFIANESNGNFKIILKLKNGAKLNALELNEIKKLPEMDVDFSYSSSPSLSSPANNHLQKNTLKKVVNDLTVEERYQKILQLLDQGDNDTAMMQLKKIILDNPKFYLAQESLISLLIEKGDIKEAAKYVEAGLKLAPHYIPFIQLNARILVANGKVKEALNLLQQYSPDIEDFPDYNALLAALEQQQGQFLASAELYKKLLEIQPVNAVWWMGLGISLEKMGRANQALEAYTKADHIENFNPELKAYVENQMTYLE